MCCASTRHSLMADLILHAQHHQVSRVIRCTDGTCHAIRLLLIMMTAPYNRVKTPLKFNPRCPPLPSTLFHLLQTQHDNMAVRLPHSEFGIAKPS